MAWHDGVKTGIGWPALAGVAALLVAFGGFGSWAAMAPLKGAVLAPGKVAVSGRNKIVQHLEGGIVANILVEEGQRVSLGEPLVLLDSAATEADLKRLEARLVSLGALEARALAERDGAEALFFAATALAGEDSSSEVTEVMADQRAEFKARLEKYRAELAVLAQQSSALMEAITGYEIQRRETIKQIELVKEERETFDQLLEKGLTRRSQVLALKRTEADLEGRIGQLTSSVAEARQTLTEIQQKILRAKAARLEEASALLNDVRARRAELLEQIHAARDVSQRIVIRAPASGTIIKLATHNPGAVITPGEKIMEIVPEGTDLIVEAYVRPQDINQVRVGQAARLQFAALDPSSTPPVAGEVVHVSADRLEDERTDLVYYLVRLAISPEPLAGFDPSMVGPGQPVDVFITTSERTLLEYLAEPIQRTVRRSFRES